jgi:hypothetical protein
LATIIGSTNHSAWSFKLEVVENSTSIDKNSSKVTVTAYIGRPSSAGASYLYGVSISCPVSITGAGTKTITYNNANQVDVAAGGWLNIGSVVFDSVPHNADGTKTVTVSATFTNNISPASGSASGSVKLTNIPRASTFTIDKKSINANGTDTITVTINSKNTAYSHTVLVAFGSTYNQTYNVAAGTKTLSFTIPYEWLNGIPSQESSNSTNIILTTYNGTTLVGTASMPNGFTIICPSDVKPIISSVTLTGVDLRDGVYVQGKSAVKVKTVAGGVYGSKINSYSCEIDGVKYTGSEFTTAALKLAQAYTITVYVTDSRGRTASKSATAFTVYEYKTPYITSFTAERQADGTTVIATLVGGVSSLNNKNTKAFTVTLNGTTLSVPATGYTVNNSVTFTNIDTDSTFVATARVADYYTHDETPVVVPTEEVTVDYHYSGKGVAMGKVAEYAGLLDVAWHIKSHGEFRSLEYSKLTGFKYLGIVDLNDIKTPGMYGVYQSTNAPERNIATLEVVMYSPDWIIQRFTSVETATTYIRRWHSGTTWGNWFTILDNTKIKDYVIDSGIYDGWEYVKWNNGRIELWSDQLLTFPVPTHMADSLWRTIVSIDMGDKVTKIISGHCPVQYSGVTPHLSRHMEYPYIAEIVIATSKNFEAFTTTIPIYVIGKWK